jgi:hypothetical protein
MSNWWPMLSLSYWQTETRNSIPEELEGNWEFLQSEKCETPQEAEAEVEFYKPKKKTVVGFYSLLTTEIIRRFLYQNLDIVSCFWPDDINHGSRGSLKVFKGNRPPGWLLLSELTRKSNEIFQRPWSGIITNELSRLRNLELRDPYSTSAEFISPLLQGLLLYLPFHVFIWKEIAINPFTDLNIALPIERLYDRGQAAHPWRETSDSIVNLLADRPKTYPPIFVHLISPRLTILKTEAEKCECRLHAVACSQEYRKWFDASAII